MSGAFESQSHARFANIAKRAGGAVLDLLYPPLCLICRSPVRNARALCADCWKGLTFLEPPLCTCCGLPFEYDPGAESLCAACLSDPPMFDRARAVVAYDDAAKGAILALKRADRLEFAQLFSLWLKRAWQALLDEADIVAPVPLHWRRLWMRRYNQSAVVAQRLSYLAGKPFEPQALLRTRPTPSQGEMVSVKARRRNMQGAFKVSTKRAPALAGRTVLLIDDVLTTGATIEACARALKRAKVEKVLVLTVARVARPLPRGV
jgi:ComF family protein